MLADVGDSQSVAEVREVKWNQASTGELLSWLRFMNIPCRRFRPRA